MAAPALPLPPKQYDQPYLFRLINTLRLYFEGQVDGSVAVTTRLVALPAYANNAAATAAGLGVGELYRVTGADPGVVAVVY